MFDLRWDEADDAVTTTMTTRGVGGEGENEHTLLWHEVKEEKPLICAECGQVFKLVKQKVPEGLGGEGEGEGHHH